MNRLGIELDPKCKRCFHYIISECLGVEKYMVCHGDFNEVTPKDAFLLSFNKSPFIKRAALEKIYRISD